MRFRLKSPISNMPKMPKKHSPNARPLISFLQLLTRRLFKPTCFHHSAQATRRLQRGLWGVQWHLARDLIHFERMAIPADLPALQRQKALALKVRANSPYAQVGFVALLQGGYAQVWFWDKTKVPAPRFARVIPEVLLQEPLANGVRLLAQPPGYECQVWRSKELIASRYWPQLPDQPELMSFQRQASVPPDQWQTELTPQTLPTLAAPYARTLSSEPNQLSVHAGRIWLGVAAVVVLLFAMQGMQAIKAKQRLSALQEQVQALQQKNEPLLKANQAKAADLAKIAELRAVLDRPNPLQIMNELLKLMPLDSKIQSYKQVSETIKVVFSSKAMLNSAQIITKVQELSYVQAVTTGDAKEGQAELNIKLK